MSEFKTNRIKALGTKAKSLAKRRNHEYITVEHLAMICLGEDGARDILESELSLDFNKTAQDFENHFKSGLVSTGVVTVEPRVTAAFQNVVQRATTSLVFSGREEIVDLDVVKAILMEKNSYAAYILMSNGLDAAKLERYLSNESLSDSKDVEAEKAKNDPKMRQAADEFLAKYCENLNEKAKAGRVDPLIGRVDEVYNLEKTMARRTKNNAILLGEAGVGKTAIVEGLAKLIVDGNVSETLAGSTVYSLNPTAIVAGTKYRGEMEERMKKLVDYIKFIPRAILFIDEIHMIMGAGAGGGSSMDMGNILKPALARGELRCIGSTTRDEYRKHFEKDAAMARRFQKITVEEPSIENAKLIILGARSVYEKAHGVTYTEEALMAAVDLTARYIADRFLPDKAFDVIDAAGAVQKIAPVLERNTVIGLEEITKEVAVSARIPLATISEDISSKLSRLESELKTKVFGQDHAVESLVDSVYETRSGLRRADKTAGAFLMVGPTGVGKTEVSKQLAATLGVPFIRFDMSEYMEPHTVSRLIGAPPGYIGYDDGAGLLVEAVENNPNCVLLLDEIEKAHPQIYNLFLQVMDDGKLKSAGGKEVRFSNVTLIMTSNVGAAEAERNAIGFGSLETEGADEAAIKRHFTPEFRNRLDAVVSFNRLKPEDVHNIVRKFIAELNTLAESKHVKIDVSEAAIEWLSAKGFDPKMGARPLARVIRNEINRKLSREILFGRLKDGGTVHVDLKSEELTFSYPSEEAGSVEEFDYIER